MVDWSLHKRDIGIVNVGDRVMFRKQSQNHARNQLQHAEAEEEKILQEWIAASLTAEDNLAGDKKLEDLEEASKEAHRKLLVAKAKYDFEIRESGKPIEGVVVPPRVSVK